MRKALTFSDELIGELKTATEYVIGMPMYNFSVPASFKAYIDQIVRVGQTFQRTDSGFQGLLTGKKATVITSSGGVYRAGTPAASLNLQEPWIRTIFGFIGIADVDFIVADGVVELEMGKRDREQYLKPIREQVRLAAAA